MRPGKRHACAVIASALIAWTAVAASTQLALAQSPTKPRAGTPMPQPNLKRVPSQVPPKPAIPPPMPLPRPMELQAAPGGGVAAPALDDAAFDACLADLKARGGEATPQKPPEGQTGASGACTVPGPVTFTRVHLPEGPDVTLDSAITIRCTLALELTSWIRDDLAAIAKKHGTALAKVTGVGGHACRPRNGQAGAQISEHASGNAFDFLAIKLSDGRLIELSRADTATRDIREEVRKSACDRFFTVLGPGADSSHADHVHIDMRQRRGGFRMCQWTVE